MLSIQSFQSSFFGALRFSSLKLVRMFTGNSAEKTRRAASRRVSSMRGTLLRGPKPGSDCDPSSLTSISALLEHEDDAMINSLELNRISDVIGDACFSLFCSQLTKYLLRHVKLADIPVMKAKKPNQMPALYSTSHRYSTPPMSAS
ncbi:hypothetical protein L596_028391 [Steinernema carpocapsae]|uniref:Uncharacterized protein n=1 Tax=Steinernema carpocapsae TaxID=34508 RepID=A0A4U5LYA6_STECR|nr:hypothetical protein L596_028391 [Steinernema carpocapsae]